MYFSLRTQTYSGRRIRRLHVLVTNILKITEITCKTLHKSMLNLYAPLQLF